MVAEGLLQWWQAADSWEVRKQEKGDCFAGLGIGRKGLRVKRRPLPAPQWENPGGIGIFWTV